MGERLIDGFTVGYALALSQFVMTWFLGWLYLRKPIGSSTRCAQGRGDGSRGPRQSPGRRRWHGGGPRHRRRSVRLRPDAQRLIALPLAEVNVEAVSIFGVVVGDHARDHLLGLEADQGRDHVLGRGPRNHRRPERIRDRRRLHVGGFVPGHRRPDLPLRVRRVPVFGRFPGRLPDRALPARGADAQLGQVHDRRRALVPAQRAAGASRGGVGNADRRRLLPDRADGRAPER